MLAELVRRAPGKGVHQRLLKPLSRLGQIRRRVYEQIVARHGVGARPAIVDESVAPEQRERTAVVPIVATDVLCAGGDTADCQSAARARIGLLFQHDVDDARDSRGVLARRRVRNHFDRGDDVRGELREEVAELPPLQRTRPAIDLDDHPGVATEADDVVNVDVHRRHVAQHVERRAAAHTRHVVDHIRVSVRGQFDVRPPVPYHD